ncbi:MAG: ISL3 family transposase, partial [Actinobacteria bacterium]|nr:ISL3 family transposase [Actinomycetota bacterium]
RTVGAIITRVWEDVEARYDRFADLRRIGIDEISVRHEALLFRMEVRGLHRLAVVAAG